jgi:signal transduction histidine kinase
LTALRRLWRVLKPRGAGPAAWILVVTLGAVALGGLAWREADRARRTTERLTRDYAAFVADKFDRRSVDHYRSMLGFDGLDLPDQPLAALRAHARRPGPLPRPPWPEIRYVFAYDRSSGRLATSGETPPAPEREALLRTAGAVGVTCRTDQALPFGRLGSLAAGGGATETAMEWSGIALADDEGRVERVYGIRLDERRAAAKLFVPLLSPDSACDCVKELLPGSLSSLSDPRRAVSFVLRDAAGQVVHRTEPSYSGPASVTSPLSSSLPFVGWTVEVAVNPEVVAPLLPYGGRGAPWTLLVLLGALALVAAALALRSRRREAELLRLRQDFVSNVSHELKTPLSRIRLFNELLMDARPVDPSRRQRYRGIIDRECRRLAFLVDNVLDFSRLDRGAAARAMTAVDLRRVAEEAVEAFRGASDEGRLSLTARLEDVPPVQGDPHALAQVVVNLLDNAVKYSPAGSPVEVSLAKVDGGVRLAVADRGPGIPEAERERIFEEFYRIESGDTQRVAGSGLGLALVRRAVLAHGGRVSVAGRVGEGSTFSVWIPAAAREAPPGP